MSVIVILLAASMLIAGIFLVAFLWSVRDGQFEDDYSPSNRILFEENTTISSAPNKINEDPVCN